MCNCSKSCKFHNKDNSLTVYALSCGYQESFNTKHGVEGLSIRMYKEPNGYHVREFDHDNKNRTFWKVYESVKEARKQFKKLVKAAKNKVIK